MIWVCRACNDCSCAVAFNLKFPDDLDYKDPDTCPWGGVKAIWKPLEIAEALDQDSWSKTDKTGVRGDYKKEIQGGPVVLFEE